MRYLIVSLCLVVLTILFLSETYFGTDSVVIQSPDSAVTQVTGLNACGDYYFQLTVTDDKGATDVDTVKVTVNCPPLPVKLESFTAQAKTTNNFVTWTSSSEHNTDKYWLMSSQDGNYFSIIATVPAKNTNGRVVYNAFHNNPYPLTYYRLRIVDKDGTSSLSHIVSVRREANSSLKVISGNYGSITVIAECKVKTDAILNIIDSKGAVIRNYNLKLNAGVNTFTQSLGVVPSGVYNAVLFTKNETISARFMLR